MYFGEEGLKRIWMIKRKYDSRNVFAIFTPDLGS